MKIAVQEEIQEKEAQATCPQERKKESMSMTCERLGLKGQPFSHWLLLARSGRLEMN
jgi:hypothetical protein